ncbi:MAG: lysophospholipid transporter LplT [Casimicrobiaceae bacterium]
MKRGFYTIMAAQFFSSLADNMLWVVVIAALRALNDPQWTEPLPKLFFVISYVIFAWYVGAFADSMPKGRVMFITNVIKIAGCALMFFNVHPLLAYGVVGLGAAAYSPAKYGILTELLPPRQLVIANGWIEGLTVASIILGIGLGGQLINPGITRMLLDIDIPLINTGIDTPPEAWLSVVGMLYIIAALFNLRIPDTGVDHRIANRNPLHLIYEFWHCNRLLWRDKLGQASLATTTLFWGAGATMQLLVVRWAEVTLHLSLSNATLLQAVVGVGTGFGAVMAAKFVSLRNAPNVIPMGIGMGFLVFAMVFVHSLPVAIVVLLLIGACAGFFVVPMNAMLQHRGHILMGAGSSIAVQNFNENLSILGMQGLYALLIAFRIPIIYVIMAFGAAVAGIMYVIHQRHVRNRAQFDLTHLIVTQSADDPPDSEPRPLKHHRRIR